MRRFLRWLTELRFSWADVAIVVVVGIVVDATVTWAHWPAFITWVTAGFAAAVSQNLTKRARSRAQVP